MVDIDALFGKYIATVEWVSKKIPYSRLLLWKEFFLNPTQVLSGRSEGLMPLIIDLYVMSFFSALMLFANFLSTIVGQLLVAPVISLFLIGPILAMCIAIFIFIPVFSVLFAVLEFIVAKILKGKSSFTRHLEASVMPNLAVFIFTLPILLIEIPLAWLNQIPLVNVAALCLNLPIQIALALIGLYGLYLKYIAFKKVHEVGDIAAVAIVLVPIILMVLLVIAMTFLFFAAFLLPLAINYMGLANL